MWTGMVDFHLIGYKSGNQRLACERLASQELSGCIWPSYLRAQRGFNHISTLIAPREKSSEEWGSVFWQPSDFFSADPNCGAVPGKARWVIAYLDRAPLSQFGSGTFLASNPEPGCLQRWLNPTHQELILEARPLFLLLQGRSPEMRGKEQDGCSQALPFLLGHPLLFSPDVPLSPTIICLLHLQPGQVPIEGMTEQEKLQHLSL